MTIIQKIVKAIEENRSFLITAHYHPDGDNIGSQLALYFALKHLGKEADLINVDPVPERYRFLPGTGKFQVSKEITRNYDTMFVLDCGEVKRLGGLTTEKAKVLINIDHHQACTNFADLTWCNQSACATGELIYELLVELGIPLSREIAICLYASIATDTGFFRFTNTNAKVFRIASALVEAGADPGKIAGAIYERESSARFRLLGRMLSEMELVCDEKVAVMTAGLDDFRLSGASSEDTENFSNYPKSIEGIMVGVVFQETEPDLYKISLRSNDKVNVAQVAKLFGGGGHKKASGFHRKGKLNELKKELYDELEKRLNRSI